MSQETQAVTVSESAASTVADAEAQHGSSLGQFNYRIAVIQHRHEDLMAQLVVAQVHLQLLLINAEAQRLAREVEQLQILVDAERTAETPIH